MKIDKYQLIADLLELVATGNLDANSALEKWPDIDAETDALVSASWHHLSHFAADNDIREKDEAYAAYQRDLLTGKAHAIRQHVKQLAVEATMLPNRIELISTATYDAPEFLDDCNRFFSSGQEFFVVCSNEVISKCRKAADTFLRFEFERPVGWQRLKMLVKLGWVGMPVAPLMAVCNKAILLGWTVTIRNDKNFVIYLSKKRSLDEA